MSPGRSPVNACIVDAKLLAVRGAELRHSVSIADLPRLAEWSGASGRLDVKFQLVGAHVAVVGKATGQLMLQCQRCLRPAKISLADEFQVLLLASEAELAEVPEQQDALVARLDQFDLNWLLEEQLLLAMPLVPIHTGEAECVASGTVSETSPVDATGEDLQPVSEPVADQATLSTLLPSQKPFANLRELMNESLRMSKESD